MAFKSSYWSCSKFADSVRGTSKPASATSSGWKQWRASAQALHPVRFWLVEELLDNIHDVVKYVPGKVNSARHYISNRFFTNSHSLVASRIDIEPGTWADLGNRFLPCMFNSLVDFVEVECANHLAVCEKAAAIKYGKTTWNLNWRSKDAGLEYLDWEATLTHDGYSGCNPNDVLFGTPTNQAIAAIEIKELYHWWTVTRIQRLNVFHASGWNTAFGYADGESIDIFDMSNSEARTQARASLQLLEDQREAEDEAMMIRLIKIRGSLWT